MPMLAHRCPAKRSGRGAPAFRIDLVTLKTPLLRLIGRDFKQVDATLRRRPEGWQLGLNAEDVAGDLLWRSAGEGWIEGRLKRLAVRPARELSGKEPELLKSLPGMSLVVDDFSVGQLALGQLELKTRKKGRWQLVR
jgi:uncharacterized protein YhdP